MNSLLLLIIAVTIYQVESMHSVPLNTDDEFQALISDYKNTVQQHVYLSTPVINNHRDEMIATIYSLAITTKQNVASSGKNAELELTNFAEELPPGIVEKCVTPIKLQVHTLTQSTENKILDDSKKSVQDIHTMNDDGIKEIEDICTVTYMYLSYYEECKDDLECKEKGVEMMKEEIQYIPGLAEERVRFTKDRMTTVVSQNEELLNDLQHVFNEDISALLKNAKDCATTSNVDEVTL